MDNSPYRGTHTLVSSRQDDLLFPYKQMATVTAHAKPQTMPSLGRSHKDNIKHPKLADINLPHRYGSLHRKMYNGYLSMKLFLNLFIFLKTTYRFCRETYFLQEFYSNFYSILFIL